MTSQSQIRLTYLFGITGVLIALLSFLLNPNKDAENWLWMSFTFFGGIYFLIRAWMAN